MSSTIVNLAQGQVDVAALIAAATAERSGAGTKEIAAATAAAATSCDTKPLSTTTAAEESFTIADESEARLAVQKAIDNKDFPTEQKQAYLQAQERAPRVVAHETDAMLFVRRCDGDIPAAARRLCLYWTERLQAFGPDRAFLPLTLTGQGALTQDEIHTLQAGFPALLPDTRTGQKVLYADRRKAIPGTTTPEGRIRCEFYIQHILAQSDPRTQTEGIIILIVLITPRFPPVNELMSYKLMRNAVDVFPTKANMHFLVIPPIAKAGKLEMVQKMTNKLVKNAAERAPSHVHLHVERQAGEVYQNLLDLGLFPHGIPLGLGGSWKIEDFFKWCQNQEQLERQLEEEQGRALHERNPGSDDDKNDCTKDDAMASLPATAVSSAASAAAPAGGGKKRTPMTEAEKREKRRLADVMHSRRKRERKKKEVDNLEQQSQRLKHIHTKLKEEENRLLEFLQQAQDLVPSGGVSSSNAVTQTGAEVPSSNIPSASNNTSVYDQLLARLPELAAQQQAPPAPSIVQQQQDEQAAQQQQLALLRLVAAARERQQAPSLSDMQIAGLLQQLQQEQQQRQQAVQQPAISQSSHPLLVAARSNVTSASCPPSSHSVVPSSFSTSNGLEPANGWPFARPPNAQFREEQSATASESNLPSQAASQLLNLVVATGGTSTGPPEVLDHNRPTELQTLARSLLQTSLAGGSLAAGWMNHHNNNKSQQSTFHPGAQVSLFSSQSQPHPLPTSHNTSSPTTPVHTTTMSQHPPPPNRLQQVGHAIASLPPSAQEQVLTLLSQQAALDVARETGAHRY